MFDLTCSGSVFVLRKLSEMFKEFILFFFCVGTVLGKTALDLTQERLYECRYARHELTLEWPMFKSCEKTIGTDQLWCQRVSCFQCIWTGSHCATMESCSQMNHEPERCYHHALCEWNGYLGCQDRQQSLWSYAEARCDLASETLFPEKHGILQASNWGAGWDTPFDRELCLRIWGCEWDDVRLWCRLDRNEFDDIVPSRSYTISCGVLDWLECVQAHNHCSWSGAAESGHCLARPKTYTTIQEEIRYCASNPDQYHPGIAYVFPLKWFPDEHTCTRKMSHRCVFSGGWCVPKPETSCHLRERRECESDSLGLATGCQWVPGRCTTRAEAAKLLMGSSQRSHGNVSIPQSWLVHLARTSRDDHKRYFLAQLSLYWSTDSNFKLEHLEELRVEFIGTRDDRLGADVSITESKGAQIISVVPFEGFPGFAQLVTVAGQMHIDSSLGIAVSHGRQFITFVNLYPERRQRDALHTGIRWPDGTMIQSERDKATGIDSVYVNDIGQSEVHICAFLTDPIEKYLFELDISRDTYFNISQCNPDRLLIGHSISDDLTIRCIHMPIEALVNTADLITSVVQVEMEALVVPRTSFGDLSLVHQINQMMEMVSVTAVPYLNRTAMAFEIRLVMHLDPMLLRRATGNYLDSIHVLGKWRRTLEIDSETIRSVTLWSGLVVWVLVFAWFVWRLSRNTRQTVISKGVASGWISASDLKMD